MPMRSSASPNVEVAGPHTHATNFLARELIYDSINGRTSLRSQTELENRPKERQKTNAVMPIPLMTLRLVGGLPRREVLRAFPHFLHHHPWSRLWSRLDILI